MFCGTKRSRTFCCPKLPPKIAIAPSAMSTTAITAPAPLTILSQLLLSMSYSFSL